MTEQAIVPAPTPSPAAPTPSPRANHYAAMLRDLATEVSDLHELADRHKMSRLQMAKWASRPRHSAMIDELSRLADRRTALLIATGRAEAARMLVRIALSQIDSRDVARKACIDLIKLDRPARPAPEPGRAAEDTRHPSRAEMDAAFEEITRRAESDELEDDHHDAPEDQSAPTPAGAD